MTHVTCRLTAKNRDHLRNPTLGNRAWAAFTLFIQAGHTAVVPRTPRQRAGLGQGVRRRRQRSAAAVLGRLPAAAAASHRGPSRGQSPRVRQCRRRNGQPPACCGELVSSGEADRAQDDRPTPGTLHADQVRFRSSCNTLG